jgi:hypothetical protein
VKESLGSKDYKKKFYASLLHRQSIKGIILTFYKFATNHAGSIKLRDFEIKQARYLILLCGKDNFWVDIECT